MMTNKVSTEIAGMEPGQVFFPSDLAKVGTKTSHVLKVLERATKAGIILRLAQGIYYYPKTDDKYGLGIIYPSYEEVAERIAERDKVTIVPTGAYAQNKLGFSTQVPMNVVYLTDGASKTIKMLNGYTIKFVHTTQKNLAYRNIPARQRFAPFLLTLHSLSAFFRTTVWHYWDTAMWQIGG